MNSPLSPVFIGESHSTCPHTCPAFQNSATSFQHRNLNFKGGYQASIEGIVLIFGTVSKAAHCNSELRLQTFKEYSPQEFVSINEIGHFPKKDSILKPPKKIIILASGIWGSSMRFSKFGYFGNYTLKTFYFFQNLPFSSQLAI